MNDMIIVMGGSFNPPTIAHLKLMQAALDQLTTYGMLDARGVYVPSSDAYVRRKMEKLPVDADRTVLPEKLRFDMLHSYCEKDCRLSVDGRELGTTAARGHTLETLQAIQRENPEADVLFIFGSDKLDGLPGWGSYEPLASQFRIILFGRGDHDLRETIEKIPALAAQSESFIILRSPEGLESISSTVVRNRLQHGQDVEGMLTHEVFALLLKERYPTAYSPEKIKRIQCVYNKCYPDAADAAKITPDLLRIADYHLMCDQRQPPRMRNITPEIRNAYSEEEILAHFIRRILRDSHEHQ